MIQSGRLDELYYKEDNAEEDVTCQRYTLLWPKQIRSVFLYVTSVFLCHLEKHRLFHSSRIWNKPTDLKVKTFDESFAWRYQTDRKKCIPRPKPGLNSRWSFELKHVIKRALFHHRQLIPGNQPWHESLRKSRQIRAASTYKRKQIGGGNRGIFNPNLLTSTYVKLKTHLYISTSISLFRDKHCEFLCTFLLSFQFIISNQLIK